MGLFTQDIKTMDGLFLHGLQDIYYAEQQITKALPKPCQQITSVTQPSAVRGSESQAREYEFRPTRFRNWLTEDSS